MTTMTLTVGLEATHVVIGPGVIRTVGIEASLRARTKQALVVVDRSVAGTAGAACLVSLRDAGFTCHVEPTVSGEAAKTPGALLSLYDRLAQAELERDGLVVAIGGGAVCDVAGLAAATWKRGVPWAVCPTTVEAQIDACLGGKTAINLTHGKNLVGAFHHPVLVVVDPTVLATLPRRDVAAGAAEAVKHALIGGGDLLAWLEQHVESVLDRAPVVVEEFIRRNLVIKATFVERDPDERAGVRVLLNFGHTIGHAIESTTGGALRHGECVSLGMVAACRIGEQLGLHDASLTGRVVALLTRMGLPVTLPNAPPVTAVLAAMRNDKKARDGVIRIVLLEGIGSPVVRDDIAESTVVGAYNSLRR